jgi:hypothetical protein
VSCRVAFMRSQYDSLSQRLILTPPTCDSYNLLSSESVGSAMADCNPAQRSRSSWPACFGMAEPLQLGSCFSARLVYNYHLLSTLLVKWYDKKPSRRGCPAFLNTVIVIGDTVLVCVTLRSEEKMRRREGDSRFLTTLRSDYSSLFEKLIAITDISRTACLIRESSSSGFASACL